MNWYQRDIKKILDELHVEPKRGLAESEVRERLGRDGPNQLPEGRRIKWWQIFLRQFTSPLVYILVIAALITALLGEWVDTAVIVLAVIVNTGIGFYQEFHADNIFKELVRIVTVSARVLRNGEIHDIDSKDLVCGDIIHLSAGVKVPADARLITARNLEVNEALLTGESSAVKKSVSLIKSEAALGDRKNMVFTGTTVEQGEGVAVVVATGADTEIGKIAELTQQAGDEATPLQKRIGRLGKILTIFIGISAIIIFVGGILQERNIGETFVVAVAVAVAGIPEGLPAALSVVLAISTQRILRKKGLVKNLIASETLGSTSVICTDKTGTLTEGKMKLKKLLVEENVHSKALLALAFANEAVIENIEGKQASTPNKLGGGGQVVRGEATDQAKMEAFLESGGDINAKLEEFPRLVLLPFDSERAYLASFHSQKNKKDSVNIFVSGAPETLLKRAKHFVGPDGTRLLTKEKEVQIHKFYEKFAKQGYRVIAVAWRELALKKDSKESFSEASNEKLDSFVKDLTFGGLAAIRDPIREDVREAMVVTRQAGIRVVMVTGDHKFTARAIGKDLGFSTSIEATISGLELDAISESELKKRIANIEIFARVNPKHKMRIIDAWQARGEAVAMTGDGVNDAPALKSADIGVSLGSGTDVTKEVADLVLLDNSFSTIISAIRQGRIAFDNIRKVVVFLLSGSFTELIIILSSLILHVPLPITAAQILWVNLVEDGPPNFALAFESGEEGIMRRKPVGPKEQILNSEAKILIFIVGIITDLMLVGIFFLLYYYSSWSIEHIRTFIFATLGTDALFYVFALKSLSKPIWQTNPFNNRYLVGAVGIGFLMVLAGVYLPVLNQLLRTVPLSLTEILIVIGLGFVEIILIEFVKLLYRNSRFALAK